MDVMEEDPHIFEQMTVTDLLTRSPKTCTHSIIVLKADDTVEHLLKVFSEHGLICAPVWSEEHKGYTQVHMLDVAAAAFNTYFTNFETLQENFLTKKILDICNISKCDHLHLVKSSSSLANLLNAFISVTHRALVIDDGKRGVEKITDIITQSDLLRLLSEHKEKFAYYTKGAAVKDVMERKPYVIAESTLAIEAFHQCHEKKYNGAGVVDDTGRVTANISVSDLRSINRENFSWLWSPVGEFLKHINKKHAPVVCFEHEPLEDIIDQVSNRHIHRLHVVDRFGKPLGIITLTSILRFISARMSRNEEADT